MPAPTAIPALLLTGPFTRETALGLGITPRVLNGQRFVRLFSTVWTLRDRPTSESDWIFAARLAVPSRAHLTGLTRIRSLGLGVGTLRPFHFVITGDLHLDLLDIFLHRTIRLPPTDDGGVTPAAAFIAYALEARLIDAIKVGDWLLHHRHMTLIGLRELCRHDRWRPGSREAMWVSRYLEGDSRSLKESETRAILIFAGLPTPDSNKEITSGPQALGIGDLTYLRWELVVEYEGSQHQEDRDQWNSDIDRYADFREAGLNYVQVTKEKLGRPRKLVSEVFRQLIAGRYAGPPPVFAGRWRSLFGPITDAMPRGGGLGTTQPSPMVPNPPGLADGGA